MRSTSKLPAYRRPFCGMALCLMFAMALAPRASAQPAVSNNFATTSAYLSILGRDPDPGGWIYWLSTLTEGANTQQQVFNFFLTSTEYANRYGTPDAGQFLTYLYEDALLRPPDLGGYDFWLGTLPPAGISTEPYVVASFIGEPEYAGGGTPPQPPNANGQYAYTYNTAQVTVSSISQTGGGNVGAPQTVQVTYFNSLNTSSFSDIASGQVFVGPNVSQSTANGCYVEWFANGAFVLYDGGNSYNGMQQQRGALSGTYCSLNLGNTLLGGSSVSQTSTGYVVTLGLTYNAPMISPAGGSTPISACGTSNEGLGSGWSNWGSVAITEYGISVTATPALTAPVPMSYCSTCGSSGNTTQLNVNYQGLNGYTGTLYLSLPTVQGQFSQQLTPAFVNSSGFTIQEADFLVNGQNQAMLAIAVPITSGSASGTLPLNLTLTGACSCNQVWDTVTVYATATGLGPISPLYVSVELVSPPSFVLAPVQTAQSAAIGGTASYQITVPVNGFSGLVTFAASSSCAGGQPCVTGQPSGGTLTFNQAASTSVYAGSVVALNVTVPATAAPGSYTITVTAASGAASASTQVTLTVAPPGTLQAPAPGATLTGGPTTFAWSQGLGATGYLLQLGSSQGASNLVSASYSASTTSATVTLPQSAYTLYAQLSTQVNNNSWLAPVTATYTVNPQSPTTVPLAAPNQPSVAVPMDGLPVQQTVYFSTGDATYFEYCTPQDSAWTARILGSTHPSASAPSSLIVQYTATAQAAPELEPVSCTCPSGPSPLPPPEPVCTASATITNRPIHISALLSSPWQYMATLTSIVNAPGGSYSWSTNNPSMVGFLTPPSGPNASQVTLGIVSTNGEATITLTYVSPCGAVASDSFTFALTNDTTAIAWVDGSQVQLVPPPNLPGGDPDPIWDQLVGLGSTVCGDTLLDWSNLGQTGVGVSNNGLTSAEIAFANEFVISGSANPSPPTQLQQDQSSLINGQQYRLYQRFQAYWELGPNGGFSASQPPSVLESWVAVGVTPEPCTGYQVPILSLPVQQNALNGHYGLTSNGLWLYQVNEARLGPEGQGVNQFLNGTAGADFTTTTPWIWSVIQFDANGYTQTFAPNTTNSTTQNLGSFPAYWIYTNGYLAYAIGQSSLAGFIALNSTFQYYGPQ
jgi:hypothetical protein